MMARTKRSRRSYGAGEWGRNRVRVFPDPKTGHLPDGVAREWSKAYPVARTPRMGEGEATSG